VKQVKGILFADYIRMLRAHKETAWDAWLTPSDLVFLNERIDPAAWYPMDVFERLGLAILAEIAQGNLALVYAWGRRTIDELVAAQPEIFEQANPRESFMRFVVLRRSLFDFPAVQITSIHDGEARVEISYGMSAMAEEAATVQTMGFLERLVEIAGARNPEITLRSRSWAGDPATIVHARWDLGKH
jgi:hypothetical protein